MIQRGDKGGVVSQLQMMLNMLKYDVTVDGIYGPETEGAIKRFQSDAFLPSTGIVDADTWAKLVLLTRPPTPEAITNQNTLALVFLGMVAVFTYFVWKD